MKNKIFLLFFLGIFLIGIASAATYCCEKTTGSNPAYCQNVNNKTQCDSNFKSISSFCETSSFCQSGTCINQQEGTCISSTQTACESNNGFWSSKKKSELPQCQLGCCLKGDSASFVTQIACTKQASDGTATTFQSNVNTELSCLAMANPQTQGACVYTKDYVKTCELITKKDCQDKAKTSTLSGVEFHDGFLCSAQELGTVCGKSQKTICDDKGNVRFVDTCGNLANIYDSSKIVDENYWTKIQTPTCTPSNNLGNKDSKSCGACDYYSGSMCKDKKTGDAVDSGDFLCKNLDCTDYRGPYGEGVATPTNLATASNYPKHGETWCATSSKIGNANSTEDINSPGATYFKLTCYNGEVNTPEECDSTRGKICSETADKTSGFKTANCRKNVWEDCWSQTKQTDCEDISLRDCSWKNSGGYSFTENGLTNTGASGICVPKYAPGFERTNDKVDPNNDVVKSCGAAKAVCHVKMEKAIGGDWKCAPDKSGIFGLGSFKNNCSCLDSNWKTQMNNICTSLGDCGEKTNYFGVKGYAFDFVTTQTISS